jgi:hypothetical protein
MSGRISLKQNRILTATRSSILQIIWKTITREGGFKAPFFRTALIPEVMFENFTGRTRWDTK